MGLRHAVALALILCASGAAAQRVDPSGRVAPAARPSTDLVLALTRAYLVVWQHTLAALVVDEDYTQHASEYRRNFLGGRQPFATHKRLLHSEVLFVRAPAENVWLSFRDVIAVDGKAVSDRSRRQRFDALFSGPVAMLYSTAEKIAEEGAQFNLGRLTRTLNTPIAALVMLDPDFAANTKWALDLNERLDGRSVWRLRFDQRKPPFAVKVPGGYTYTVTGHFSVEPETGRIVEWDLKVFVARSFFHVKTRYGPVASVREGWMPLRMEDEYEIPMYERLRGVATYSNHRLYRTGARIVSPP